MKIYPPLVYIYLRSKRFLSLVLNFSIVSLKLSVISISNELAIQSKTNKLSPNSALIVLSSSVSFFFHHDSGLSLASSPTSSVKRAKFASGENNQL